MTKLEIPKKAFNSIYVQHLLNNQHPRQIVFGGSSSGKSYAIAQRVIIDIISNNERNYLIVRHTLNSLRKSTWNEVLKTISKFKLQKYFIINKSDMVLTCVLNNCQIIFAGLDDPEKIKSVTPIKGVITDVWIEEATQISYDSYKQLEKRLRGKTNVNKRILLSFNPILRTHWIYKEFFSVYRDDIQYVENERLSILKTTYRDNKFLTKEDVDLLESETDKYYRDVYVEGKWGVLGNLIFKNFETKEFDYSSFDNIRNGVDWGFGSDPFAFVRLHIDQKKKEIYIFDEIYAIELADEETISMIKERTKKNEIVTCDSSEPKSISNYRKNNLNAKAARKGAGSIETGIKFLQGYKIYIHPKCTNTKQEFESYKFKETMTGETLPVPVDKNNHIIDAIRYAIESDITGNKFKTIKNPF